MSFVRLEEVIIHGRKGRDGTQVNAFSRSLGRSLVTRWLALSTLLLLLLSGGRM